MKSIKYIITYNHPDNWDSHFNILAEYDNLETAKADDFVNLNPNIYLSKVEKCTLGEYVDVEKLAEFLSEKMSVGEGHMEFVDELVQKHLGLLKDELDNSNRRAYAFIEVV